MFLENIFPPIPSELIMPLAGFTASRGDLQFSYVILAGAIGSLAGVLPWFFIGKLVGKDRLMIWADRHGRWLTLSGEDIEKSYQWFHRHGQNAVLFGRLIPGIRTYISVPAGISDINFLQFLIYSLIGTAAWTALLTFGGYVLGENYQLIERFIGPIAIIVIASLVIGLVVFVLRRKQHREE